MTALIIFRPRPMISAAVPWKKTNATNFAIFCHPKPFWQLRQVNIATGEFKDLASDTGSFGPAWDPAQPWRVLYSGDQALVQLDLNQNSTTAFSSGNRDRTPAFSPDGQYLATAYRGESGMWQIHRLTANTGERLILAAEGNNVAPAWSPEGNQIAFLSDRSGHWDIWVMNADGAKQVPLFAPDTLVGIDFRYDGVDEKMLSWN